MGDVWEPVAYEWVIDQKASQERSLYY